MEDNGGRGILLVSSVVCGNQFSRVTSNAKMNTSTYNSNCMTDYKISLVYNE